MAQHEGSSRTSGLAENITGLLCYVLGWLTGIIFLLIHRWIHQPL